MQVNLGLGMKIVKSIVCEKEKCVFAHAYLFFRHYWRDIIFKVDCLCIIFIMNIHYKCSRIWLFLNDI